MKQECPHGTDEMHNYPGENYQCPWCKIAELEKEKFSLWAQKQEAETRVKELERDKERIDWLEAKQDSVLWDDSDFWCVWDGSKANTANQLRNAIDAAMNSQQKGTQ